MSQPFTVSKATPSVSITWLNSTYDGTANAASAQADGVAGETNLSPAASLEYFNGSTAGVAGTGFTTAPKNAGTYAVRASFAGNGNYNGSSATKSITIGQADSSVSITWLNSTYDGTANAASAQADGVAGETNLSPAASLEYFNGSTAGVAGTGFTTAPKNAGTYAVRASFAGNGNYNGSSATKSITIGQADSSVSITWLNSTYDGTANAASAQADGVAGETNLSPAASLEYFNGSTAGVAGTGFTTAPKNAGTYAVRASFAGNGNYNGSSATKSITIGQADSSVSITWLNSTYDGTANAASAQADGVAGETNLSPAASLEYFNGSTAGVAGTGFTTAPKNAGTYAVRASFAGNGNYNGSSATKSITIGQADSSVSITWLNSTYDGTANAASAQADGVAGETNLSPAASLEYFNGSTAGVAGTGFTTAPKNAGTYAVRASFAGNGNYNGSSATKSITIGQADSSVSITWLNSTYDGTANAASAQADGVAGETNLSPAASLEYFNGSTAGVAGTGFTTAPKNAGTYAVRASFAGNGNYNGSSATKSITIGQADSSVSITWLNSTYDGTANAASAQADGVAGETNLSPAASLEYFNGSTAGVAGTGFTTAPKNAGTYAVRASFAGNGNYNGSSATKSITIGQADSSVSITWLNSTYDGTANAASAQADGVAGETNLSPAASLEYFNGSTAGVAGTGFTTAPKNAGTYAVRASFAGNGNYNGSSATKSITIGQADSSVSITWLNSTYDGTANAASAQADGVAGETNLSPAASLEYFNGSTAGVAGTGFTTAPKNAGTYAVRASFAGNGNYNGSSATKSITIGQADSSVSITWLNSTYDGTANAASAQADGVAGETNLSPAASLEYFNGSTAGVAGTGFTTAPKNAGTYAVRASFAGNGNYNGSSATKSITIGQADSSVSITWLNSTYDGTANAASAQADGVAGETNLSPAASLEYFNGSTAGVAGTGFTTAPKNAGTYAVRASFAGNGNYNGSSATKSITIGQADSSVSITWLNSTYDGTANAASAQADGVAGETNLSPAASLEYFNGSTAGVAGTGFTTAPKNAGTYAVRASFAGTGTTTARRRRSRSRSGRPTRRSRSPG